MRVVLTQAVAVAIAFLMPGAGPSAQAPEGEPTTVHLGEGAAPPGGQVVLPVSFSSAENVVKAGAIDLRVTLPKAKLSFVKIDPSGLAVGVSATVQANVKDGDAAGPPIVEAHISTIGPGGGRLAIPSGPVAYLTFTIDTSAEPGDAFDVSLEASVRTTDDPPRTITPVGTADGQITVASPPVPMCFFYMH